MCYFAVGVLSHPVDICIYNNVACTEHFHKKYRRIGIWCRNIYHSESIFMSGLCPKAIKLVLRDFTNWIEMLWWCVKWDGYGIVWFSGPWDSLQDSVYFDQVVLEIVC